MENFEKDIGRLEGNVDDLRRSIDRLEKAIISLSSEIKSNKELLDNVRGGLKFIVWFIGVVGILGAVIGKIFESTIFHIK